MPIITLETYIEAPVHRVFDLCRSIDLHMDSTLGTDEKAIAGRTYGLIELGETVTWRAKHFGIYQNLTVKLIALTPPLEFKDVMIRGAFKSMKHTHTFRAEGEGTIMTDRFDYESPLGILGKIADQLFLKQYMTQFLEKKNKELKTVAENNRWKKYLT